MYKSCQILLALTSARAVKVQHKDQMTESEELLGRMEVPPPNEKLVLEIESEFQSQGVPNPPELDALKKHFDFKWETSSRHHWVEAVGDFLSFYLDVGDGGLYMLEDPECDGQDMHLRSYDESTGALLGETPVHLVLSLDRKRILKMLPDDLDAGWDATITYGVDGTTISSVEVYEEDGSLAQSVGVS
mgnify:FL=1